MTHPSPIAHFAGRLATGLIDVTSDPAALDSTGWWAVMVTFEGEAVCARFSDVRPAPVPAARWRGPGRSTWSSSLDRSAYAAAVDQVRELIAAGDVYQVNVCRVLSAPLPEPSGADVLGLAHALSVHHPAPHAGVLRLPEHGIHVVSASPELYLERAGRDVRSRPIKGTAPTPGGLLPKDRDENVMIVDLVRNDLGMVCDLGSVRVDGLCEVEQHPGLAHLVSTVSGRLVEGAGWADLLAASFPPGSVTGAPKSTALRAIRALEPVPRGPYCGAVGWVDADEGTGGLAVGIRTFWLAGGRVHLGTGAGITWASDADAEWAETELKAARLLAVASGVWEGAEP